jgi:hypothetical protein
MKQSISLARTLHPELTLCTHQLRDDPRHSHRRQERHASDEVARRRDRPRDTRSGWQVSFDKNMSTGSIGKSTRGLRTDRRHLLSRATHPRHLPVRVPFQALLSSAVAIGVPFQACRHILRAISSTRPPSACHFKRALAFCAPLQARSRLLRAISSTQHAPPSACHFKHSFLRYVLSSHNRHFFLPLTTAK